MTDKFIKALENNSVSDMQSIAKSDLHNHSGRGDSLQYIGEWANSISSQIKSLLIQ